MKFRFKEPSRDDTKAALDSLVKVIGHAASAPVLLCIQGISLALGAFPLETRLRALEVLFGLMVVDDEALEKELEASTRRTTEARVRAYHAMVDQGQTHAEAIEAAKAIIHVG